jgi:hypothetical protein
MQRKLHAAGLLITVFTIAGVMLAGCVDEQDPTVIEKVTSSVRFVHAVSDAPAVDIWVDNAKVATSVSFKQASAYLTINAGERTIDVTPAGSSDTSQSVFRQRTSIRSFMKMTLVLSGLVGNANITPILTQERFTYSDETSKLVDSSDVKLINVNAGSVPAVLVDGTNDGVSGPQLITSINSGSLSAYKRIKAGSYKFYVTSSGIEVTQKQFEIKTGHRYSFILVGSAATPENSELLTLQDDPN